MLKLNNYNKKFYMLETFYKYYTYILNKYCFYDIFFKIL